MNSPSMYCVHAYDIRYGSIYIINDCAIKAKHLLCLIVHILDTFFNPVHKYIPICFDSHVCDSRKAIKMTRLPT